MGVFMKRFFALLLLLSCVLCAVSCRNTVEDEPASVYFIGKVVSVHETSLMVEVTDSGDCGLAVGTPASVSLRNLANSTNASYQEGSVIRVEFDGLVQESYPVGIPSVHKIETVK
jgi:hypothetical protein